MCIYTGKLPRVIAIKIEESNKLNVETLSLHLTAKVELHELFFSWVEAKAGHDHVVLVIIVDDDGLVVVGGGILLALAMAEAHGG